MKEATAWTASNQKLLVLELEIKRLCHLFQLGYVKRYICKNRAFMIRYEGAIKRTSLPDNLSHGQPSVNAWMRRVLNSRLNGGLVINWSWKNQLGTDGLIAVKST